MTSPPEPEPEPGRPPPADRPLSRRFFFPALLFVLAGVERIVVGVRGSTFVLVLGVVFVVAGLALGIVVRRARGRW